MPKPEELVAQAKAALAEAGVTELPTVLQNSLDATTQRVFDSTTTLAELNNARPSDLAKAAYVRNGLNKIKELLHAMGARDDLNVGKTIPWLDGRDHRG